MTADNLTALPVSITQRLAMYGIHYGPASAALFRDAIESYGAALLAARDAERGRECATLDWLESQGHSYGFEDMIEGNRWDVSGAYMTLRELCDAALQADTARAEGSDNG